MEQEVNWQQRLESNRQQLDRLARSFEEEAGLGRPIIESVGDVISTDFDNGDFAQAIADRHASETLIALLDQNREQVERALERLEAGRYGYCEDCEEMIPAERLAFRPEATRCVGCQGRHDRLSRKAS
mgnify:CR=1 FL=1